jgi:hypothetical protein
MVVIEDGIVTTPAQSTEDSVTEVPEIVNVPPPEQASVWVAAWAGIDVGSSTKAKTRESRPLNDFFIAGTFLNIGMFIQV